MVRLTIVSALNMTGTGSRICTRHTQWPWRYIVGYYTVTVVGKAAATAVDRNTKGSKHRMVARIRRSSSYMPGPDQQ